METPGWAVVITKPMCEEIAEKSIRAAGFRAYLPRYKKILVGHRVGNRGKAVIRPLFPRYLFVELWPDQQWSPLRSTTGVSDLIWLRGDADPRPSLISPEVVEAIREAEHAEQFDMGTKQNLKGLKAGNLVRITAGPFAELVGHIAECDSEERRVIVLLGILGGTKATLPGAALEIVAAG